MVKNKQGMMMKAMVIVIIVLVLVLLYFFVARPGMDTFVMNKQIEGVNFAYADLVTAVQTQGYFALPLGENQTLILVPYVPPEAPAGVQA